jgi:Domain of unknown function (DUF4440)
MTKARMRLTGVLALVALALATLVPASGALAARAAPPAPAQLAPSSPAMANFHAPGAQLAAEFLRLLHAKDMAGLDRFLSPAFLLQRPDGSFLTKAQYLANPAKVDEFQLTDVVGKRTGDTRVIRYTVTAIEHINGQQVTAAPVPRISTYVWRDGAWRLLAHANFSTPKA